MKKKILILQILLVAMLFAGCGSASEFADEAASNMSGDYRTDVSLEDGFAAFDEETPYDTPSEAGDMGIGETQTVVAERDKNEKLVYESRISVDTLEFEKTVAAFDAMIQKYDGFVENRIVYDDGSGGIYWYGDNERMRLHHTLDASVRIPSGSYRDFMDHMSGLGDIRSCEETVQNMTTTYGTLASQLEILETEYSNYLGMLENMRDENAILKVREDLTELSVQIATIRTQMSSIDTDVAWSTVNITIREVESYEKDNSTFVSRLQNTFEESWENLLAFLEGVLFWVILNWFYIVLLVILVFAGIKTGKYVKKRNLKKQMEYMQRMQNTCAQQTPPTAAADADEMRRETE